MKTAALAVAVMFAFAANASAVLLPPQTVSTGTVVPNVDDVVLTFDQFSGNPADLTGVHISGTISITGGTLTADNDGAGAGTVNFELGVQGFVSSSDVSLTYLDGTTQFFNNIDAVSTGSQSIGANDTDSTAGFDDDGGPDNAYFTGSAASASDNGSILPTLWNVGTKGYIGSGTFDLLVDFTSINSVTGTSGLAGSFTAVNSSFEGTVQYEVIPEPASAALLGLSGVALLARRRR